MSRGRGQRARDSPNIERSDSCFSPGPNTTQHSPVYTNITAEVAIHLVADGSDPSGYPATTPTRAKTSSRSCGCAMATLPVTTRQHLLP